MLRKWSDDAYGYMLLVIFLPAGGLVIVVILVAKAAVRIRNILVGDFTLDGDFFIGNGDNI